MDCPGGLEMEGVLADDEWPFRSALLTAYR
ncbi:MAG: hypothetical protein ACI8RZ_005568 [Myxococcota bacterium]|jgi:hypothetical protein